MLRFSLTAGFQNPVPGSYSLALSVFRKLIWAHLHNIKQERSEVSGTSETGITEMRGKKKIGICIPSGFFQSLKEGCRNR